MLMIKLLDELLKNSFENIVKVKVNTGNKEQLVLTALYCSIVDLSDAFLALVHQEKTTGSLSVIRTLSETYVDLINLDKHSGYYDSMLLEYYQQQSKYLKNSKNGNKYLESLKSIGDINSEVSRVDDIITSLKKKKVRQFKIKEKFEMAGMQDEYYSVYLQLCGESHGNLEALISRHFHEIDDNLVICVGGDSSRWIECYILFLLHILINSGRVFFKSLDGHSKLIFENLVEKINTELKNTK